MENAATHVRAFTPRYYEMDRFGNATPLTMLSLFEETAFTHCEETEFGVYRLREEGLGWVLLHGTCRFLRYPRFREAFTVETRIVAARRFYGLREFVVRDVAGAELGSCRSMWTFYDVDRRRPVPIPGELLSRWGCDPSVPLTRSTPAFEPPEASRVDPSRRYEVRISDIDTNGHVNNVNYLEWALESVPREVHDSHVLTLIQGVYRHQVTYGQTVSVAREDRSGGGPGLSFAMSLYAGPERPDPVAYARTEWTPRDA